ncbi:outer membrane protein, multidrug efflux system [Franzmannia pantelleriensis]|uniref:Outer membrane protein, multidrug efflux system n=1 Tax=Franzmannia pantelleriensis TaxID=48727 RepID=A0A1G9GGR5_9GAMM|nr:efflux transporter outer membrane subunit [Halomonas pantelleriensis]SDK99861.1 outer membrane protein, multidrug efflux system [Halomonas pantelleriensis]
MSDPNLASLRRITRLAVPLVFAAVLAGCAVGPDYRAPDIALPDEWPEHVLLAEEERSEWRHWWRQFEDPRLDALVERATAENLDIRLQLARIQEARAQLGLAQAEQLPSVGAQAEAARDRTPATASPFGVESTDNTFSVAGQLSYEIDLWGRLAREREASEALLEESVFAHDAVRLNVITDVVATYFDLKSAEQQRRITESTLESREETFRLEQIRFDSGETDELALRQAQSELETTRAQLPAQVQRVRSLEGALAALVGLSPAELFDELDFGDTRLDDIALPTGVPTMLPSSLLERRPDIRSAEAGLVAANAGIGVAEASRLPSLNLSGLIGTAAGDTSSLFTSAAQTWGLGATVMGPIFDFGRSRSRIDTAEALAEQAEQQYRATVNMAFNEVRDALVSYETSGERVEATRQQVEAIRRTQELAEVRYREGFVGFIEVLDAQRALLSAELALAEAVRDRLTATATLFKALGGGWESDLPGEQPRDA